MELINGVIVSTAKFTSMTDAQRSNRKLLILFIIALIIALIPWVVLAQEPPKKEKFFFDKEAEQGLGYTKALKVATRFVFLEL